MKLSQLYSDSDTRPFRFAVVFAVVVTVALLTSAVKSQEIIGPASLTTSWPEAMRQSQEQNAPIMLLFAGSDWCPWSEKLTREVFAKPDFDSWAESRVVPVMVDFPRKSKLPAGLANQNNDLLNRYRPHLNGFPTALFVDPDGTVIGKLVYEPDGLLTWIEKAQRIVGKLDKVAQTGNLLFRKASCSSGFVPKSSDPVGDQV